MIDGFTELSTGYQCLVRCGPVENYGELADWLESLLGSPWSDGEIIDRIDQFQITQVAPQCWYGIASCTVMSVPNEEG